MPVDSYPEWFFYPDRTQPPEWVDGFIEAVAVARPQIDSAAQDPDADDRLTSNKVLAHLRLGLVSLGFQVESGLTAADRIRRPVLFGPQGRPRVNYDIDGVHDDLGIVLEVEAGRGARGNAVYRDLVRSSLIVGVQYLALGVAREYKHRTGGRLVVVRSFVEARDLLDAVFASGQLGLPFKGVLLFGY